MSEHDKRWSKTRSETLRTVFAGVAAIASVATLLVVLFR